MMLLISLLASVALVGASSHSEAPGTAKGPRSDLSDVYFTRVPGSGPAAGQEDLLMAMNVSPLQRSDAGPNYSPMDTMFVYQYHLDLDGDAVEDTTFQFIFGQEFRDDNAGQTFPVNTNGVVNLIPLVVFGPVAFDGGDATNDFQTGLNNLETYRVRVQTGVYQEGTHLLRGRFVANNAPLPGQDKNVFTKPVDNAGTKSFSPNPLAPQLDGQLYDDYVENFVYRTVNLPGCTPGASKLFVGPRRESFSLNLGATFDLINIPGAPVEELLGGVARDELQQAKFNTLDCSTVVSFVLQAPVACIHNPNAANQVVGAWASVRKLEHVTESGEEFHVMTEQVSRLGNPLINELLIGLPFKDEFSASHPKDDAQFIDFILNPTLPNIIKTLFPVADLPDYARFDLLQTLFVGLPDLNRPLTPPTPTPVACPSSSSSSSSDDDDEEERKRSTSSSSSSSRRRRSSSSSGTSSSSSDDCPTPAPTPARSPLDGRVFADVLRLNLALGFPVTPYGSQSSNGALDLDLHGFPNGRRLGDDVVDIYLRAAMGALCGSRFFNAIQGLSGTVPNLAATLALRTELGGPVSVCPLSDITDPANPTGFVGTFSLTFTDRSPIFDTGFSDTFPYFNPPIPGNLMGECWRQDDPNPLVQALVDAQFSPTYNAGVRDGCIGGGLLPSADPSCFNP